MSEIAKRIADNLAHVRQRIEDAARRSGRSADDVKLVAVTKYVDVRETRALIEAGCQDLAESRPQELWHKVQSLEDAPVRWHLIGHLQRNKVKRTLPLATLIHSGDSERLLTQIEETAVTLTRRVPVLLEVNVSGDEEKHGFAAEALEPLLPKLAGLSHIEICGLMAMAGRDGDDDDARRDFVRLRELHEHLSAVCPAEITLRELSMGMSGDFETAIEEGATIVRVGSALFTGIVEP